MKAATAAASTATLTELPITTSEVNNAGEESATARLMSEAVGAAEGPTVGVFVGLLVGGTGVGEVVGVVVGTRVGAADGTAVGEVVGVADGDNVGVAVASHWWSSKGYPHPWEHTNPGLQAQSYTVK
jgi:hypothetical protein